LVTPGALHALGGHKQRVESDRPAVAARSNGRPAGNSWQAPPHAIAKPAVFTHGLISTVGAIFDHAANLGPLSCEIAGGSPAMICARNLFIISVVKPGTGLCCQTPPRSSNNLPRAEIAAPSLPADHCEMAVTRGFASLLGAGKRRQRKRGRIQRADDALLCWHVCSSRV